MSEYIRRVISRYVPPSIEDTQLKHTPPKADPKTVADLLPPSAQPVNPQAAPHREARRSSLVRAGKPLVTVFHNPVRGAALLANNSATNVHRTEWLPDYWIIHARLTAGYIWAFPGTAPSAQMFRLDSGVIELPLERADTVTVETVGASGWYSLYAVREAYPKFEVFE